MEKDLQGQTENFPEAGRNSIIDDRRIPVLLDLAKGPEGDTG